MSFKRVCIILIGCLALAACSSGLEHEPPELSPTAASGSIRVKVASGSADAEEVRGRMQLSGGALDFDSETVVGLRFSGARIPPGTKITAAHIEFRAIAAGSGKLTLTVRGDDSADAGAFRNRRRDLSARRETSAASTWRPLAWRGGQTTRTSSLTGVVQEIVDRSDWRSGNGLGFSIRGSGTARRAAMSRDKGAAYAPTLVVSFGSSGGGSNGGTRPPPTGGAASQREWHKRLLATIKNPRYPSSSLDPKKLAATGDLYKYARNLNNNLTTVMLAYRETGDRDLVRQIDNIMNIARGKLRDTNGDGYRNWRWLTRTDSSSGPHLGKDTHVMDEMMTHSLVAAAAYTLKQAGYSSSARFWTDYLENDFEAKWRGRSGKRSGFPFISHKLMHPTTQFIRYNFYMSKLTGNSSYYAEARRLTRTVRGQMKTVSTPRGVGYIWRHDVTGRGTLKCQPMVYVRYTTQALADLATADTSLFSRTFMTRVANTMAYRALKNPNGTSLARDICGGGTYGSVYMFAQHPYAQLAPWDGSGRLEAAAERAYAATERWNLSSPTTANVAAQMVFSLGR